MFLDTIWYCLKSKLGTIACMSFNHSKNSFCSVSAALPAAVRLAAGQPVTNRPATGQCTAYVCLYYFQNYFHLESYLKFFKILTHCFRHPRTPKWLIDFINQNLLNFSIICALIIDSLSMIIFYIISWFNICLTPRLVII